MNKDNKKIVYLAGDMLLHSGLLKREEEKKAIQKVGYQVYAPHDDKEINDKQNQTEESNNNLAERIVEKDTIGVIESDIVIVEPLAHAQGTLVELGQIKGMKDLSKMIKSILNRPTDKSIYEVISDVNSVCDKFINQKVYAHYGDIRRTDIPERGDRRSWGVNQYVYGVVLDLTNGKGFQEFDDIIKELE